MDSPANEPAPRHDAYAALRIADFRRFLAGHLISVLSVTMQTAVVGWQLYERTNSKMALGLVGLVQVAPMLLLTLPAGHAADHRDRRKLLMAATTLAVLTSCGLVYCSLRMTPVWLIYAFLFLSGVARAFQGPARSSLMPQLVPPETFTNSVSWVISGFELSAMLGPALGGLLVAWLGNTTAAYAFGIFGSSFYFLMLATLTPRAYVAERPTPTNEPTGEPEGWAKVVAGFRYVWHTPLLLAGMTLDLFAVLLGGAVALLPVYARDILQVGPSGLGLLQAAPSLGAVMMAFASAHLPPFKRAGKVLLWAVAGFGAATIVFGLSRSFPLSLLMLFLTGAFDNISVVIRHTLATILVPDEMRGRVAAVNGMFINASNELGRFESGSVAALTTPVFSVVSGGIGTLLVVALVALRAPQLRAFGSLQTVAQNAGK
jgi:MFS family permease